MKVSFKLFAANSLLVIVSVFIALTIAEITVRCLGIAPQLEYIQKGRFRLSSNPLIRFELVPNFYADDNGRFLDFLGTTNSLGFRDREHPRHAPQGTQRIIALGDSITQGKELKKMENIYTAVIENVLNNRGYQVEVFNFGVSGYNTQQEVETLIEKGLPLKPHIVVLQYCLNDKERNTTSILTHLLQQAKDENKWDYRFLPPFLGKSALYRLIRYKLLHRPYEFGGDWEKSYDWEYNEASVARYLGILRELAAEHHFQVVVAVFPLFENLHQYEYRDEHLEIQRLAQRNGFFFIDLLPVFQKYDSNWPVAQDYFHPSEWGHECAGKAIAGLIEKNILRPRQFAQ